MNDLELQSRLAEMKEAIEADPHCLSLIGDWISLCREGRLSRSAELAEYQLEYLIVSDFGKIASPRTDTLQDTIQRYRGVISSKFALDIPLTYVKLRKLSDIKIEFKICKTDKQLQEFIKEYYQIMSNGNTDGKT